MTEDDWGEHSHQAHFSGDERPPSEGKLCPDSSTWRQSSLGMEDQKVRKSKNWLGSYKSWIFVSQTPGSELQKLMQAKEKYLRAGGREHLPIEIIETAGKPLERILVKQDPFSGNKCMDKSCLPNRNPKNRISCMRNNIGYELRCKLRHWAGGSNQDMDQGPATYFGETGENMHTQMKSHESKFRSKWLHVRKGSTFYMYIWWMTTQKRPWRTNR